jgi:6-phosphogluconolactonase
MQDPHVHVFDAVGQLQAAAAAFIARMLGSTSGGSTTRIALSGGSTPKRVHQLLASTPGVRWEHLHVYWGDERAVPPHDEQSNYRMAQESLLAHVPVPANQVHRMRGELDPRHAADEYELVLRDTFGTHPPDTPSFDVSILGIGADGHTASLFPGTAALHETQRWVVANHVPQLDSWRITLTYPVINSARITTVLVTGAEKADAVRRIFDPNEADRPPAAFIRPTGSLHWFLDRAAARHLPIVDR